LRVTSCCARAAPRRTIDPHRPINHHTQHSLNTLIYSTNTTHRTPHTLIYPPRPVHRTGQNLL
jgi:hypothetical protein